MRRKLQSAAERKDDSGDEIECDRRRHRDEHRSDAARGAVAVILEKQGPGDDQVAGEEEPWRKGPSIDAPLRQHLIGTRLLVADVEQKRIAERRPRRRKTFQFRRFAEQRSTHWPTLKSGTRSPPRRSSVRGINLRRKNAVTGELNLLLRQEIRD